MDPARNPDTGEIARRAYALWEKEGRLHGRDRDHWSRAERELGRLRSRARGEGCSPRKAAAAAAEPAPAVVKAVRRKTAKPT